MPKLFGKSNKDKDKAQKKRQAEDRFMNQVLGANFLNAKSTEILDLDVNFTNAFSEASLKHIGKDTDRMLYGRGEFDGLYQKTKDISKKYTPYMSGDVEPKEAQVTEMIDAFTELETLASTWLAASEKKWSSKGSGSKDKVTRRKESEARGMLMGARTSKFQLENRAQLEDPATAQLVDDVKAKRRLLQADGATVADLEAYRSADVKVLTKLCGTFKPPDGTSDVKCIKGADGEVAYAFKSIAGESDMMGTPKGFAAAREVLMSKLCDSIQAKTGLRMPWPQVTMANVEGQSGALIDGVRGEKLKDDEQAKTDLPAEALQQILLCNFAGAQFDIKWEDVRATDGPGGQEVTCMDGGAAMPDPDTATTFLLGLSDGRPGLQIIDNGNPETGGYYPEAQKPLSKDMVKQFLNIDTTALKAELLAHAQVMERDHGLGVQQLGLDTGLQTAMTSIEGIQKILKDTKGKISLVDFVQRYHAEVIEKQLIAPKRDEWNRSQLVAYRQLVNDHGRLFAPVPDDTDIGDLYRRALHPEVRARLAELVVIAGPRGVDALLESCGFPLPQNTIGPQLLGTVKRIRRMIDSGLAEYDNVVAKYPGLIVAKTVFATLEEAYREVLSAQEEFGLKALAAHAVKLSETEGVTVTAADVLGRYGYVTPTSGIRAKWDDINRQIKALQAQQNTT